MDIFKAIKQRRSVRRFRAEKLTKEVLDIIIDAATWAPSASDIQGWRFIIVDDQKLREQLVYLGALTFIKDAPSGILVLYDKRTVNLEYLDYIQSASAAIQNMLLAACSLGIGSCWTCRLPSKAKIRRIFHIPYYYDPVAYIVLGFAAEETKQVARKYKVDEVVSFNRFAFSEAKMVSPVSLFIHQIRRKLYFLIKELLSLWKR